MTSINTHSTVFFNSDFANINSWLFVPATRMDRVAKAFASGADAVIIDLEDTVAPVDKAQARIAVQSYYDSQDYQPIWLRINRAGSAEFAYDIALCQQLPNLAGIILAKAEHAAAIEYVYQATNLPVIALLESALGLAHI